jgi:hypothetical protein
MDSRNTRQTTAQHMAVYRAGWELDSTLAHAGRLANEIVQPTMARLSAQLLPSRLRVPRLATLRVKHKVCRGYYDPAKAVIQLGEMHSAAYVTPDTVSLMVLAHEFAHYAHAAHDGPVPRQHWHAARYVSIYTDCLLAIKPDCASLWTELLYKHGVRSL